MFWSFAQNLGWYLSYQTAENIEVQRFDSPCNQSSFIQAELEELIQDKTMLLLGLACFDVTLFFNGRGTNLFQKKSVN